MSPTKTTVDGINMISFNFNGNIYTTDLNRQVMYKKMIGTVQGFAIGQDGQPCYVVNVEDRSHSTNLFPVNKTVDYVPDTIDAIKRDARNVVRYLQVTPVLEEYWGCNGKGQCTCCPVLDFRDKRPYDEYNTTELGHGSKEIACTIAIPLDIIKRVENLNKKER